MNTQQFIDKWTDRGQGPLPGVAGERAVMARDIEALVSERIAALQAENARLRDQLQAIPKGDWQSLVLNVFGHPGLPEGSIARYACDEARKVLDNQT